MRRTKDFGLHGFQLIRHSMQTFRVTQEQISVGRKVTTQTVDDFQFRFPLKIDDDVAAKDQVERAEDFVVLFYEIQPLKTHHLAKFLCSLDLSGIRAKALQEILP